MFNFFTNLYYKYIMTIPYTLDFLCGDIIYTNNTPPNWTCTHSSALRRLKTYGCGRFPERIRPRFAPRIGYSKLIPHRLHANAAYSRIQPEKIDWTKIQSIFAKGAGPWTNWSTAIMLYHKYG